jgi:hypothetical protein
MRAIPVAVRTLPMGFASSSDRGFAESLWPQAKPDSKPVAPRQRPANSRVIVRVFMGILDAEPEDLK